MPAAAHEPEEVQSKFFWGACFGNVRPFCSAAYRLPEIHGCQGTVLSWSMSILSVLLRRVLPTNVILQLICKRRESHLVFRPDFIGVQIELFEDMISPRGRKDCGWWRTECSVPSAAGSSMDKFSCSTFIQGLCRLPRLSVRRFMRSCGCWERCCHNCGFFWSTSDVFIPSTIDSLLFGQFWLWMSLGVNLLNLGFPGNGRHASYAIQYLAQSFQVTWGFGRATFMPWRHLCFRKSSCHLLNQHCVNVFT